MNRNQGEENSYSRVFLSVGSAPGTFKIKIDSGWTLILHIDRWIHDVLIRQIQWVRMMPVAQWKNRVAWVRFTAGAQGFLMKTPWADRWTGDPTPKKSFAARKRQ